MGRHAQSLRTVHNCGVCGHSTSRVPKVCGNPLAALGCQLVEGVLYISKLPVTADGKVSASAPEHAHVGCVCHVSSGTRGARSCREAAPKGAPKSGSERESAVADHHKQREATLASRNEALARLGTLAVEPTFLARVHEATW